MGRPLTIAAAQPLSRSHDVAGNAKRHADLVVASAADLVVFPELSLTGYELDAAAVEPSDDRLTVLVDACRATDSTALVGAPVAAAAGGRSIAMLAIDGSGTRLVYRKMWLGSAERAHFTSGSSPAVLGLEGWRVGLAICKDTGVTDHAAATMALGCDLYVAGVLESADDADVQPRRARDTVRRHGVGVVVASFAGSTGGGYKSTAGQSAIWRPDGSIAALASSRVGDYARATISRENA